MANRFYITTPIYYVNDRPHIGHAYTTFAADALARYHRMIGNEVFFLTGTDENSQKNVNAATQFGQETKSFVDQMSAVWQNTWDALGLTNDDFIRTTENRHRKGVEKFFQKVNQAGDIYKNEYHGWYCVGCEAFKKESDLVDGKCPDHNEKPQYISEINYFFRLTKYREKLLQYIENNPDWIQPEIRKNEVINYIKDEMEDISISRQAVEWGIPVPIDKSQVLYVWFDALVNYLTGLGYGSENESLFNKYWPSAHHLFAKDIIKFHCALWPAMLMSAELPLPKKLFVQGYFTIDGQKMSKSLGNAINPLELTQKYSVDALRYFLFREIPFGGDGDFSENKLKARYKGELADGLGNLLARTLTMIDKYNHGLVPKVVPPGKFPLPYSEWQKALAEFQFEKAIKIVWDLVDQANKYIATEKPWEKAGRGEDVAEIMFNCAEILRHISWLLYPLMPQTAEQIQKQLGLHKEKERQFATATIWGSFPARTRVKKGFPLFPKVLNKVEAIAK